MPPDCLEGEEGFEGVEGEFVRDVFFRGTCPPNPEPCDNESIFLFCAQAETLTVSEPGGRLPFNTTCNFTSGAFRHCRGDFRIICGGTYLVFVKIIVPANETLTTRLFLAINGEEVPNTAINITKTTTGNSQSYELNALISVDADDILSVRSSNAFTLTDNDVLASITMFKV
jgi:hypothetical protein